MNTNSEASGARRTPDEIALDLTMHSGRIREQVEYYSESNDRPSSGEISFSQQLVRTFGSAQRYVAAYLGERMGQSVVQGAVALTPTPTLDLVKRNPLLAGIAATAIIGIAAAAGPKQVFSWTAKMLAIWRVFSAIRHQ